MTETKHNATARVCKLLPIDYELGENDVLCGGGSKNCLDHVRNNRFRTIITANLNRYNNTKNLSQRADVVYDIIVFVRHLCQSSGQGIGFVKKNNFVGRYYEVDDKIAREKVTQAFRDANNRKRVVSGLVSSPCRNMMQNQHDCLDKVKQTDTDMIRQVPTTGSHPNPNVYIDQTISRPVKNVHAKELLCRALDSEALTDPLSHANQSHSIMVQEWVKSFPTSISNEPITSAISFIRGHENKYTWHRDYEAKSNVTISVAVPRDINNLNCIENPDTNDILAQLINDKQSNTTDDKHSSIDASDNLTFLHLMNFTSQWPASWDEYCLEPRPL